MIQAAASVLRDRYEIEAVIGAGAQGRVSRARDLRHGRTVAVKTCTADVATVLREARLLYHVQPHAHLPLLRDDFTDGEDVHLVIDWVDGENLARRLERDGPLDLDTALTILRPVADALDHLHAHDPSITHGDVKPANVVCAADGRVVLVDFGLAGTTAAGAGTRRFRAPEAGSPARGPLSDIYGLAATTYALLTGDAPGPGGFRAMPRVPQRHYDRVRRVLEWGLQVVQDRRPARGRVLMDALGGVAAPSNLPSPLGVFVGRHDEIAALDDLVRSCRLVTIVGPGGAGKTRLAIEGARQLGPFCGGVVLVDLAPIRSGVAGRLLLALAENDNGRDPLDMAVESLAAEPRLVVLDNAEHVVDEVAEVSAAIARRCPAARVLVTSRESLRVPGEQLLRLGGLPIRGSDVSRPSDAARLLLDRSGSRSAGSPTVPDVEAAESIAARVDGLPLALELAAASAAVDGLPATAQAVTSGLEALGELRGTARHHRNLATMVDRSYIRLRYDDAAVLRAASVLIGGIDDHVLAEVTGRPAAEVGAALERAAGMSLIERAGARWRLNEPVRHRLGHHLAAEGEAATITERLARWATKFFVDAAGIRLRTDAELSATFASEEENLAEGVRLAAAAGQVATAVVNGIAACYQARSRRADAVRLIEELRTMLVEREQDLPLAALAAHARLVAGDLRRDDARALVDEIERRAIVAGDNAVVATCLVTRAAGNLDADLGLAWKHLDRAATLLGGDSSTSLTDEVEWAYYLHARGIVARSLADHDDAARWIAKAVAHAEAHRLDDAVGQALTQLVPVQVERGDFDGALVTAERVLEYAEFGGSEAAIAEAWTVLGLVHGRRGELDDSERCLTRARDLWDDVNDPRGTILARFNLGVAAYTRGDLDGAEVTLAEVQRFAGGRGDGEAAASVAVVRAEIARLQGRSADAHRLMTGALPVLRNIGNVIRLANALTTLAELCLLDGDEVGAAVAATEAAELFDRAGNAAEASRARSLCSA